MEYYVITVPIVSFCLILTKCECYCGGREWKIPFENYKEQMTGYVNYYVTESEKPEYYEYFSENEGPDSPSPTTNPITNVNWDLSDLDPKLLVKPSYIKLSSFIEPKTTPPVKKKTVKPKYILRTVKRKLIVKPIPSRKPKPSVKPTKKRNQILKSTRSIYRNRLLKPSTTVKRNRVSISNTIIKPTPGVKLNPIFKSNSNSSNFNSNSKQFLRQNPFLDVHPIMNINTNLKSKLKLKSNSISHQNLMMTSDIDILESKPYPNSNPTLYLIRKVSTKSVVNTKRVGQPKPTAKRTSTVKPKPSLEPNTILDRNSNVILDLGGWDWESRLSAHPIFLVPNPIANSNAAAVSQLNPIELGGLNSQLGSDSTNNEIFGQNTISNWNLNLISNPISYRNSVLNRNSIIKMGVDGMASRLGNANQNVNTKSTPKPKVILKFPNLNPNPITESDASGLDLQMDSSTKSKVKPTPTMKLTLTLKPNPILRLNPILNSNPIIKLHSGILDSHLSSNPSPILTSNQFAKTNNEIFSQNSIQTLNPILYPNPISYGNSILNPNTILNPNSIVGMSVGGSESQLISNLNPIYNSNPSPIFNPGLSVNTNSTEKPHLILNSYPVWNLNPILNPYAKWELNSLTSQLNSHQNSFLNSNPAKFYMDGSGSQLGSYPYPFLIPNPLVNPNPIVNTNPNVTTYPHLNPYSIMNLHFGAFDSQLGSRPNSIFPTSQIVNTFSIGNPNSTANSTSSVESSPILEPNPILKINASLNSNPIFNAKETIKSNLTVKPSPIQRPSHPMFIPDAMLKMRSHVGIPPNIFLHSAISYGKPSKSNQNRSPIINRNPKMKCGDCSETQYRNSYLKPNPIRIPKPNGLKPTPIIPPSVNTSPDQRQNPFFYLNQYFNHEPLLNSNSNLDQISIPQIQINSLINSQLGSHINPILTLDPSESSMPTETQTLMTHIPPENFTTALNQIPNSNVNQIVNSNSFLNLNSTMKRNPIVNIQSDLKLPLVGFESQLTSQPVPIFDPNSALNLNPTMGTDSNLNTTLDMNQTKTAAVLDQSTRVIDQSNDQSDEYLTDKAAPNLDYHPEFFYNPELIHIPESNHHTKSKYRTKSKYSCPTDLNKPNYSTRLKRVRVQDMPETAYMPYLFWSQRVEDSYRPRAIHPINRINLPPSIPNNRKLRRTAISNCDKAFLKQSRFRDWFSSVKPQLKPIRYGYNCNFTGPFISSDPN